MIKLIQGDSLIRLAELPENAVDAVVTDPPYGLSFMGKKWDYDVPSVELWREVLRVLKPGGHVLSFGGTRTYHRMVVNIEDAGFEIRDQIMWIYGSGFPKSMDVSKAIDKAAGAEREVTREATKLDTVRPAHIDMDPRSSSERERRDAPATDLAKQWQGWGTALKPANEPIVLARKPLEKGLTVAENVLKWGTGAISVDGCRIAINPNDPNSRPNGSIPLAEGGEGSMFKMGGRNYEKNNGNSLNMAQGRWPANIILDEVAAEMLDEQSGYRPTSFRKNGSSGAENNAHFGNSKSERGPILFDDSGGASRFFYVAKASKRERGIENNHPTVKPIKLMEYLIKLITPPNGIVLDPFMGSGSTGVACKNLNRNFIGIEKEEKYFSIAKERIYGT